MERPSPRQSHLFLLRLWLDEPEAPGASTGRPPAPSPVRRWHGTMQHLLSGEAVTFDDWPALIEGLVGLLAKEAKEGG